MSLFPLLLSNSTFLIELLQGLLTWSNLCRGCRAVPRTSKAVGLFVAFITAVVRRSPVKVSRNALCFSEDTWSVALYVVYSYLNIRETGSSCGTYSQWVWLGACRAIQQAGCSHRGNAWPFPLGSDSLSPPSIQVPCTVSQKGLEAYLWVTWLSRVDSTGRQILEVFSFMETFKKKNIWD